LVEYGSGPWPRYSLRWWTNIVKLKEEVGQIGSIYSWLGKWVTVVEQAFGRFLGKGETPFCL
jgi:hypothetical protein